MKRKLQINVNNGLYRLYDNLFMNEIDHIFITIVEWNLFPYFLLPNLPMLQPQKMQQIATSLRATCIPRSFILFFKTIS